jgi:hypothetical protein
VVAGLPTTSLLSGILRLDESWKMAVFGHKLDEASKRPEQVVYSDVPWL